MGRWPKVLGSRNLTGVPSDWEVELLSGWVPAELLSPKQATEVTDQLAGIGYIPMDDIHEIVFDGGEMHQYEHKGGDHHGKGKGDGQQGQGDGSDQSDGDGEGQGDGQGGETTMEDLVDKRIKLRVPPMIEANNQEFVTEAVRTLDKKVTSQIKRLEEEVASGNLGGGAIVKIELKIRDMPELPKEGLFHHQFPKLLRMVAAGKHAYLPGPPGSGKSHAGKQVADALGFMFGSISLGPTTPESRLWGGKDANGNFHEPTFVTCARYAQDNPESGAAFLLDELDNGHPGIIATLNSAMANNFFTAPNGDLVEWGNNFVIIGSANTFGTGPTAEFSGRNRLDAATLDRFGYLPWDTDTAMEKTIVNAHLPADTFGGMAGDWLDAWTCARTNVKKEGLKVFVTMRGAINGAQLIAAGFSLYEAMDIVLLHKLPDDQAKKVNPL